MDNWCCPICAVVAHTLDMLADGTAPDSPNAASGKPPPSPGNMFMEKIWCTQ